MLVPAISYASTIESVNDLSINDSKGQDLQMVIEIILLFNLSLCTFC